MDHGDNKGLGKGEDADSAPASAGHSSYPYVPRTPYVPSYVPQTPTTPAPASAGQNRSKGTGKSKGTGHGWKHPDTKGSQKGGDNQGTASAPASAGQNAGKDARKGNQKGRWTQSAPGTPYRWVPYPALPKGPPPATPLPAGVTPPPVDLTPPPPTWRPVRGEPEDEFHPFADSL